MSKITLEVDTDKLSVKAAGALTILLDECLTGKDNEIINEPLFSVCNRLLALLNQESNGNQLNVIKGFLGFGRPWMTPDELHESVGKKGPALAGVMSSLTKNWRKARMPGDRAVSWDSVDSRYLLAVADFRIFNALKEAYAGCLR